MRVAWLAALVAIWASTAEAADPVALGTVSVRSTYTALTVVADITGDDNHNSGMALRFREQGATDWHDAAMAMVALADQTVAPSGEVALGFHHWAATAMFLKPGTTYDLGIELSDPDGGGRSVGVPGTTRAPFVDDPAGRTVHVVAGSSIQDALDSALAGDIIVVSAGTYSPFTVRATGSAGHPIVIRGDGDAIIDGAATDRGLVSVESTASFITITGLTMRNGAWGVDLQSTHEIEVLRNTIEDVSYGVYNRREDGTEFNQTVCDNVIRGRTPWPQTDGHIPSERAIDLRGGGNIVCYNDIANFGDCVSLQPFTNAATGYGNEVYGNDLSRCVDDGIEIDFNIAGARVFENRVFNTRHGVSLQPIYGGPAYVFRNELFNFEESPYKLANSPLGFVIAHNTSLMNGAGLTANADTNWGNAYVRNNVIMGTDGYAFELQNAASSDRYRDFDYDAYFTSRDGTSAAPRFKWNDERYNRLGDLPPGVEAHGVSTDPSELRSAALPASFSVEVAAAWRDLRPANATGLRDKGVALANLNDPYALVGAPDLGAYEAGAELRHYGPRSPSTDGGEGAVPGGGTSGGGDGTPDGDAGRKNVGGCSQMLGGREAVTALAALWLWTKRRARPSSPGRTR